MVPGAVVSRRHGVRMRPVTLIGGVVTGCPAFAGHDERADRLAELVAGRHRRSEIHEADEHAFSAD
jgi:hypothetical protein